MNLSMAVSVELTNEWHAPHSFDCMKCPHLSPDMSYHAYIVILGYIFSFFYLGSVFQSKLFCAFIVVARFSITVYTECIAYTLRGNVCVECPLGRFSEYTFDRYFQALVFLAHGESNNNKNHQQTENRRNVPTKWTQNQTTNENP